MEIRRCTEALLRSPASPISTLWSTQTASRWHKVQRTFATSSARSLEQSSTATSPPSNTPLASASAASQAPQRKTEDVLDGLTQTLGWTKTAQRRITPDQERRLNGGSSSAQLLEKVRQQMGKPSAAAIESTKFNFDRMDMPEMSASQLDLHGIAQQISSVPIKPTMPIKLVPSTGRAVYVTERTDVSKALKQMDRLTTVNRVRSDFTSQRYHERGGLKRKRLRRQRWRTNFKASFQATVQRVNELKRQGW